MSERTTTKLDFRTGDVTEVRRQTTAQTFAERVEGARADLAEQLDGPILASAMAVRCDGCGRVVEIDKPELPAGWVTTEAGELCPKCQ